MIIHSTTWINATDLLFSTIVKDLFSNNTSTIDPYFHAYFNGILNITNYLLEWSYDTYYETGA